MAIIQMVVVIAVGGRNIPVYLVTHRVKAFTLTLWNLYKISPFFVLLLDPFSFNLLRKSFA